MELSNLTITIITGVISSVLGAIVYAKYSGRQQRKIQQKIEELDYEEKFLDKISKGNIELLRSSFKVLFIVLGLTFISISVILFSIAIKLPELIQYNLMMIGFGAIGASAILALRQAKSLMQLNDLPKAKKQIDAKRKKLKDKLK